MKLCSVEGCNRKSIGNGYCGRHYQQIKIHGKIKRTMYDPNQFIIEDNICWVILCDSKCIEKARSKFDFKYYEILKDYKWHITQQGYVESFWFNEDGQHQMFLHSAIIELSGKEVKDNEDIDHKDQNKLNNLENNLRICTRSQNQHNRKLRSDNTSNYIGVSWHKDSQKWVARIEINSKRKSLGYFSDLVEAAKAYNNAASQYFGEFAALNKIPTEREQQNE